MSHNFETTFTRPAYNVDTYVDPTPVAFDNPQAVADCLVDGGDYDGYTFDPKFDEQAVLELALEDARKIIAVRQQRLASSSYLSQLLAVDIRRRERQKMFDATVYVPAITPVDLVA